MIETDDFVEVGGLSDLPAAKYLVTVTIHNGIYSTESSLHTADINCKTEVNGVRAEIGRGDGGVILREKVWHPSTDVFPVTLPAASTIIVSCQFFDGGDAADAILRLSALQVSAIH